MRLSIFAVGALCLGLAVTPACSEDDDPAPGGKGGSGGGGTGGGGGSGGGTGGTGSGGSGADVGGETGGAAVTYAMVKPILMEKCLPCHATGGAGAGAHKLAEAFEGATTNAYSAQCAGKKKGECLIVRVKDGTMPLGKGCTGNPVTDSSKPACLTQAQQDVLQGWATGGLQP